MNRIVFGLVLLFLCNFAKGVETKVIRVGDQEQFNRLNYSIHQAVIGGASKIIVKLDQGYYYFNENHVLLSNIDNPELDLRFVGNNAMIISGGKEVSTDRTIKNYNYNSSVVNINAGELINVWDEMQYADSIVEILDVEERICRIHCNETKEYTTEECKNAYIMITAWCRTYYYKIIKVDNSYIYFIADNLKETKIYNKKGYNVNDDYLIKGVHPRFRLCNLEPVNEGNVHVCENQTFLFVDGCKIKNLSITGISFLGNKAKGDLEGWPYSLMVFKDVQSKGIRINNCRFVGQNSRVIMLKNTDDVIVDNNVFTHNFRNGVTSYNSSFRTNVNDNVFEYNGESLSYERCITCQGSDYHIYNNTFKNYGYCAISVGFYFGSEPANPPGGIVENNTLVYTDDWMNSLWKHSIMDGGAIYLWTRNDIAIIRNNVILNYGGVAANRGIYCDDGAKGVEIYGNIIMGVINGYSIDSRRVKSVDSKVGGANINNKIYDNICDGGLRFVGHEGENGCFKGRNFMIYYKGKEKPDFTVSNIENQTDDEYVEITKKTGVKYLVSKKTLTKMTSSQVGLLAKEYFECY